MCNFNMILSKPEIVIHIYHLLPYEDQLRLSKASVRLRIIFENYIWKERYVTLKIFEKTQDFVISTEKESNRLCLTPQVWGEFQSYYSPDVRKLVVKNIVLNLQTYQTLSQISNGCMIMRNQLNLRLFRNLTSLCYDHMAIPIHHLGMLSKWLPNLQLLSLLYCAVDEGMGEVIRYVIPGMKNLTDLCIQDFERFRITYGEFVDIVSNTKLARLRLTATIEPDVRCLMMDQYSMEPCQNLEELYIQAAFLPIKWSSKYCLYLNIFKCLTTLTLETVEEVNDGTLATLAHICRHLATLHIRFTIFDHIKHFVLGSKVTHLSLTWCRGLNYKNLRQIVRHGSLLKFCSKETRYEGAICGLTISPRIRSLNVDRVLTKDFLHNLGSNGLHELTWYHPWDSDDILKEISFASCERLRVLDIHEGYLSIESISQLRSLHKLTMPHPLPALSWHYIKILLQHPSLRELTFRDLTSESSRQINADTSSNEAIETHITYLQMPINLFEAASDFWLNLFRGNRNLGVMRFTFYPYEKIDQFMRNIIEHSKFPGFLRHLDFCGFTVDCNRLRRNFESQMEKLKSDMDYKRCWYDHGTHYIALRRL